MNMPPSAFWSLPKDEWNPQPKLRVVRDERQLVTLMRREAVRLLKRSLSSPLRQRLRLHLQVMGFVMALNMVEKWANTGEVWTLNRVWRIAVGTPRDPEDGAAALPTAA